MKLQKDIASIKKSFPKLHYLENKGRRFIRGELDICDNEGNYWETFNIAIVIPDNYPFGVPQLIELSSKIPREENRHVSKTGLCCVDIDHELLYWAKRGILISDFIRHKVYPFFANQLYYEEKGKYANGEYDHNFDGVRQFYKQKLKLDDPIAIIRILNMILSNKLPGRNQNCPCGQGQKYKVCHWSSVAFLKSIGEEILINDLHEFQSLISSNPCGLYD